MTERQRLFSKYLAENSDPVKSAVLAGYSQKSAPAVVRRLMANPEIVQYIKSLGDSRDNNSILTSSQCKEVLSSIAVGCESSPSEKIKAIGMLIGIDDDKSSDRNINISVTYGADNEY